MILVNQLFGLEIMGSIIRMIIIRVGFMFIRWILSIVSDTCRCVLFLFISCFVSIIACYSIYCNGLLILYMFIIILYGKLFVDSLPTVVDVVITIYLWVVTQQ